MLVLKATQNISQRGHRENAMKNKNPDNFWNILKFVAKHDPAIPSTFVDGSLLKRYASKQIQNEILSTSADMVRDEH